MSQEIVVWIKKLIITAIIIGIGYGMYLSSSVIVLILISGFITIITTPLVEKWNKYRIPEWLTILFVYIIIFIVFSIIIGTIIPIVINYISTVIEQVILASNKAQVIYAENGIAGFGFPKFIENSINFMLAKDNITATLELIKNNAGNIQSFLTNNIAKITNGGIALVSSIGGAITNGIFIAIASFFMTLERKSIATVILNLSSIPFQNYLKRNYPKIQNVCIAWIRATVILGFSIFLLTYIGLHLVEYIFDFDTKNTFSLALISGIMEFVPYIGPILSTIPAIIIGLGISWKAAGIILILYIIIQQGENNFLVPYIMSKNLSISPLFVFIVMLFGATLGGIFGIILSIPIAGMIKVLYEDKFPPTKKIPTASAAEKPKNPITTKKIPAKK